jgi:hypothetical protein
MIGSSGMRRTRKAAHAGPTAHSSFSRMPRRHPGGARNVPPTALE